MGAKSMEYGGKHRKSFAEYHAVPAGWEEAAIAAAHTALKGQHPIQPVQIPQAGDPWLKYRQTLYNIADGVKRDDAACVELAIRFIELHFIGSYAGFLRSLMARRLKHAQLTDQQKGRLSRHFLGLLRQGEHCQEFGDYLKLWHTFATPRDLAQVEEMGDNSHPHSDFMALVRTKLGAEGS